MRMSVWIIIGLLSSVLVALVHSGDGRADGLLIQSPPVERYTWEKPISFAAGGEIEIENLHGRILVKEGEPGQVMLVAESAVAPMPADDLKIAAKKTKLSLKCAGRDQRPVVDLHVAVPPGVRLQLRTGEGTVQVHARPSSVRVETLSGDVVLNVPVDDAEIEIVWMEGYIRYGGPPLQKAAAPATAASSTYRPGPSPAKLVGRLGRGQVRISVQTLNGWVEVGPATLPTRVVLGTIPPQPMTRAARVIARQQNGFLGAAIRTLEPRLERVLEPPERASPTKPLAEEDVVQLDAPLVNLNVSVTDAKGKVISGLRMEDFTVTEDGVEQPITHFATEMTPFNLVLLLDVSGSTREKSEFIRQAANRFLDLMHPGDKIAILLFARDVEVIAHLTGDRAALRQALARMTPPLGSTAVYDAIAYTLVEELGHLRGQRNAVVVVTDGRDSSLAYADTPLAHDPLRRPGSFLRFSDLLMGVRYSDVVVYPIAIDNEAELAMTLNESGREQVRADSRRAQEQLRQLADISGGRFYCATRLDSLDSVYEQIAADLRTIYSLAYMPTRTERDGRWRRVEVSVARPGARVRCPRGYFAR